MPYNSMLHIAPINLLLLGPRQEPYKKDYLLTENIEEFSGKSSEEWTSRQKKDTTERVTGLGRRTREQIAKWNQMTALRFHTGGRHQPFPASLRGSRTMPKSPADTLYRLLVLQCSDHWLHEECMHAVGTG